MKAAWLADKHNSSRVFVCLSFGPSFHLELPFGASVIKTQALVVCSVLVIPVFKKPKYRPGYGYVTSRCICKNHQ